MHDHIEQYNIRRYGPGTSLLYILTEKNLLHLFRIQVAKGHSINAKGGRYKFPIIAAVVVGNTQMLELLLERGADPDNRGADALAAAVDNSNVPAVKILLEHGYRTSKVKTIGYSRLIALLKKPVLKKQTSIVELLLLNRKFITGDLHMPTTELEVIWRVVNDEDIDIIRLLIKFGIIEPGHQYAHDCALNMSIEAGKENLVRLMLDEIADLSIIEKTYDSPLLSAVEYNQENIVRMLLKKGADVNALYRNQHTVLWVASQHGRETMVRTLLEHGADVNATGENQNTALRVASYYGFEAVAQILLEHGAHVNEGNPLYWAVEESPRPCEAIVFVLLKFGADPNQYSDSYSCRLPLHAALAEGMTNIVKLLLDHGANANKPSRQYANVYSALDSCDDSEKRAACEALLLENSVVWSPVVQLT